MRKENSHQSEMVSQLLYGECYKLIEKRKKWVKIRGEWDGYEGWIDHNQVHIISKEDFEEPENLTIELDCSKVQPEKSESEENDINDLLGIGK